VGVVHAVLRRECPAALTIDLTHAVAPFDVRAGSLALTRALPHLGPGVVLAVVDPGVGGPRRAVAVEAADGRWFVGPDNGLFGPALAASGGARRAFGLPRRGEPSTFDGRDLFAPAAAALAGGRAPEGLGTELDPADLIHLDPPLLERRRRPDGRLALAAEVLSVDRFGNVQLAALAGDLTPAPRGVVVGSHGDGPPDAERPVRAVRGFAELVGDDLGLLADGNGQLALVLYRDSAAARLGLSAGDHVELVW
jgi:S-adenosylmethionine hydrolase